MGLATIGDPERGRRAVRHAGQGTGDPIRNGNSDGLASWGIASLTRARLFLDAERPFITCKAGSTKNKKDARQYINSDLADELQDLVETKNPGMPMFDMPAEWDQAAMLRADLANARHEWLRVAEGNQEEHARREKSDFLNEKNHDGQVLDFHSLRHTCVRWLAMTGAHPKAVQVVMWHSSITLTMDTYGHLFPGQEAETIARLPEMFGIGMNATDTMLSREGTAMPSAARSKCAGNQRRGSARKWRCSA